MPTEIDSETIGILPERSRIDFDLSALQGSWSAEQYLLLTDHKNQLIEFTDGVIEVLPIPTDHHQTILACLYDLLLVFIRPRGGKVLVSPLRLQIRPRKYREPDILLVCDAKDWRRQNRFWYGADLVVEIVSPDDPKRDLIDKRVDYAEATIPEYWIVDPEDETIMVLRLEDAVHVEHGVFTRGDLASSVTLEAFAVGVTAVFDGA